MIAYGWQKTLKVIGHKALIKAIRVWWGYAGVRALSIAMHTPFSILRVGPTQKPALELWFQDVAELYVINPHAKEEQKWANFWLLALGSNQEPLD